MPHWPICADAGAENAVATTAAIKTLRQFIAQPLSQGPVSTNENVVDRPATFALTNISFGGALCHPAGEYFGFAKLALLQADA
jgi:hypothetical protein